MNIRKKKLLVITGAGASVEFGMPSVSDVNHFLSAENEKYITIQGNNETLYDYIQKLQPTNDFEEVIFRFSQLQYILSDNYYYTDLIDINKLPHIYNSLLDYTGVLNSETLGMAVSLMHDKLVNKFREFSRKLQNNHQDKVITANSFFSNLSKKFSLGIINFNYDNVMLNCTNNLYTGFNKKTNEFGLTP